METITKNTKLSYQKWKALKKKLKRKVKRTVEAKERDFNEYSENEDESIKEEDRNQIEIENKSRREEELWLKREKEAQDEFKRKKEKEEKERKKREEEQRQIMTLIQTKEKALEDMKEDEENKKQQLLQQRTPKSTSQWHNPQLPSIHRGDDDDDGGDDDDDECPFYQRVGACRYGLSCSKTHNTPLTSTTILIPHMFASFQLDHLNREDHGGDSNLEFDERDIESDYREFYDDVYPELRRFGRIRRFVVCCNHAVHLRGNVYVDYESNREAEEACGHLNGRWFDKRLLSCGLVVLANWSQAICGLYLMRRCQKGIRCNYLHPFKTPTNSSHTSSKINQSRSNRSIYRSETRSRNASNDHSECKNIKAFEMTPKESCEWIRSKDKASRHSLFTHQSTSSRDKHEDRRLTRRTRSRSRSNKSSRYDFKNKERKKCKGRSGSRSKVEKRSKIRSDVKNKSKHSKKEKNIQKYKVLEDEKYNKKKEKVTK